MRKQAINMYVAQCYRLNLAYALLKLRADERELFPDEILPGQFVQIEIPDSKATFLRRPISVAYADVPNGELWLLVRDAGAGTHRLVHSHQGDIYNVVLPLGRGFSSPSPDSGTVLLVGGGVGMAPLLYLGKVLSQSGCQVKFALGARSAADILLVSEFAKYGEVWISTEDGSLGQKGLITSNSVFDSPVCHIACCGPTPMMKAVARIAHAKGISCEVSLENMMACGLGACLCCVEDTDKGNVCVCTEGPVFNINQLKWEL